MNNILKFFKYFLIGLPVLEIIGFIIAGAVLGILPTIVLLAATTLLGIFIIRNYPFVMMLNLRQCMARGEFPAIDMLHNSLIMTAGFLLIIPGFITDIIGLILLIPSIQQWIISKLIQQGAVSQPSTEQTQSYRIIEGEVVRDENKDK